MVNITSDNKWKKLVIVGDRVLIKPAKPEDRTSSGLYLPPGVQKKKKCSKDMLLKRGQVSRFLLLLMMMRFGKSHRKR